jgi:Cdc6-like AAA superfamily ATPase
MMDRINSEGRYDCLYVNIEPAQASRDNVDSGIRTVCECIASGIELYLGDESFEKWVRANKREIESQKLLFTMLKVWSQRSKKPIILFLDEVDALVGDTLISLLRQIRSGYNQRPNNFPQSIILCGVRDIRDYRIH